MANDFGNCGTAFAGTIDMHEETIEQIALADYLRLQYPRVIFCAQLAGLNVGARGMILAKRLGYLPGMPDVVIFAARGGAHGLVIEMKKRAGGKLSPNQVAVLTAMAAEGYSCHVANGFDEAKSIVDQYLA